MSKSIRTATKNVRSRVFESARWAGYVPRSNDIIIGTYPKCGTTWMQRIVSMLVFESPAPQKIWELSPWPDMRIYGPIEPVLASAEAQIHRRFFKTHLPLDALTMYEGMKFIHVARDGRDAAMSFHNHLSNFTTHALSILNEISRDDPKFGDDWPLISENAAEYFTHWVEDGGAFGDEGASFFYVENSYWKQRHDPSVLLVHYNDLKADRAGEMRRIADFLKIDISESLWPEIIAAASFEAMKEQGDTLIPDLKLQWEGGAARFFNKGTNGRWQNVVVPRDLSRYDAQVKKYFTGDLARWLENGRLIAGDPRGSAL